MNDLIKVSETDGIATVNARDLHKFLESKQRVADWIKNRIEKYEFQDGESYVITLGNRSDGLAGKPRKEYATPTSSGVQTLITPKGRETFRLLVKSFVVNNDTQIELFA